jgi:hypothetical protein
MKWCINCSNSGQLLCSKTSVGHEIQDKWSLFDNNIKLHASILPWYRKKKKKVLKLHGHLFFQTPFPQYPQGKWWHRGSFDFSQVMSHGAGGTRRRTGGDSVQDIMLCFHSYFFPPVSVQVLSSPSTCHPGHICVSSSNQANLLGLNFRYSCSIMCYFLHISPIALSLWGQSLPRLTLWGLAQVLEWCQ